MKRVFKLEVKRCMACPHLLSKKIEDDYDSEEFVYECEALGKKTNPFIYFEPSFDNATSILADWFTKFCPLEKKDD